MTFYFKESYHFDMSVTQFIWCFNKICFELKEKNIYKHSKEEKIKTKKLQALRVPENIHIKAARTKYE